MLRSLTARLCSPCDRKKAARRARVCEMPLPVLGINIFTVKIFGEPENILSVPVHERLVVVGEDLVVLPPHEALLPLLRQLPPQSGGKLSVLMEQKYFSTDLESLVFSCSGHTRVMSVMSSDSVSWISSSRA